MRLPRAVTDTRLESASVEADAGDLVSLLLFVVARRLGLPTLAPLTRAVAVASSFLACADSDSDARLVPRGVFNPLVEAAAEVVLTLCADRLPLSSTG